MMKRQYRITKQTTNGKSRFFGEVRLRFSESIFTRWSMYHPGFSTVGSGKSLEACIETIERIHRDAYPNVDIEIVHHMELE